MKHINGIKGKMLALGIAAGMLLPAVAALIMSGVSPASAYPGETRGCNGGSSCHANPPTTINVSTDITSTTVAPESKFTVNISWSGGGSNAEVNWPTDFSNIGITRDNTLFSPNPRIPFAGSSASGSTSSELTAPSAAGIYTVRVYASRTSPRETDYQDITVTVAAANQAPVLASIGNKTVTEGKSLSFTISANDPNGDVLAYSASNLPSGASFDTDTHVFSWTPTIGQAGSYPNVHFEVSDGSLTDSEDITIAVNAPAPDTAGPLTSTLAISPNPAKGATIVTLQALVNDLAAGGSNIAAAEYSIDTVAAVGTGTAMSAVDGAFDEITEAVTATLDVSALSPGRHTIYVRGQDSAGNWGAVARVNFRIPRPKNH